MTRRRIRKRKKQKKNEEKNDKLKYEISSDEKNYTKGYKTERDLKKKTESESPLGHYNLGADTSEAHMGGKNAQERDSDTEVIIQKIISRHNEKKEIFKKALKQGFSDALNEIDSNIKALVEKQKSRRHEFHKKYEQKKKRMIIIMEKEISMLTREINALTDSLKKIGVNRNEVLKLHEEGKSILSSSELLQKSQAIIKKVKENLQKMNSDIIGKEKEYSKRKKLCFKALATAYE